MAQQAKFLVWKLGFLSSTSGTNIGVEEEELFHKIVL